jgi:hypothetical protein
MNEHERMLVRLGEVLGQIARPHLCDQVVPVEIRANLCQLGLPCTEETPRQTLITELWARKRSLQLLLQSRSGGPGATPPAAA